MGELGAMKNIKSDQIINVPCPQWAVRPWQQEDFLRLSTAYKSQRLPHALMLVGPEFVGKTHFSYQLARYLLCQNSTDKAVCNKCQACLLASAGTHPDWINVQPEDKRKALKVDTIREAQEKLQQTAQQGGNKICTIAPAEAMTDSAANALLKILEEPPDNTYFILVTHQSQRMLPTIKSRCQQLRLGVPSKQSLVSWLTTEHEGKDVIEAVRMSRGFPERANDILGSGINAQNSSEQLIDFFNGKVSAAHLAGGVEKSSHTEFVDVFLNLITERTKSSQTCERKSERQEGLDSLPPSGLHQLYLKVAMAKLVLERNANPRLLVEALLVECFEIYTCFDSEIQD